jgi:plastocyanin
MVKAVFFACLVGLLLIFLAVPSLAHEVDNKVVVHMTETGFEPRSVLVPPRTMVIFENVSSTDRWPASNIHPTHAIYPEFDPQTPILPGKSWEFTFTKVGDWKMHDHLHPELTGSITVKESEATPSVSSPAVINWWMKLINWLKSFLVQKGLLSSMPKPTPRPIDDTITQDSQAIFTDENALYSYVKKFGSEKTVKHLHELGATMGDCHQPAHKAGHFAYEIFNEKAFQTCSAECHSGCYHGATEAYFKEHGTAHLEDNLKVICSSELNPFFSHQCIHGIGHGLMAWSNYEIHEALKHCDSLSTQTGSCHSGVFMENIVGGLAQEAGHLTKYLNDDPLFPCTIVEEKYRSACYFYQSSRMIQIFKGDFSKVADICARLPDVYRTPCFLSLGRDVGGANRNDGANAIKICGEVAKTNDRSLCLSGAVQDFFWDTSGQQEALEFCRLVSAPDTKAGCYETIFGRAIDVLPDNQSKTVFCNLVETEFSDSCRSKLRI